MLQDGRVAIDFVFGGGQHPLDEQRQRIFLLEPSQQPKYPMFSPLYQTRQRSTCQPLPGVHDQNVMYQPSTVEL